MSLTPSRDTWLDHLEAVALDTDDGVGGVGEQPEPLDAEILEDLRADAELARRDWPWPPRMGCMLETGSAQSVGAIDVLAGV